MLVLSRKIGERILIADNIAVTILEIRGDKVRLGIDAPKTIPIHREEVALAIAAESDAAHPAPHHLQPIVQGANGD